MSDQKQKLLKIFEHYGEKNQIAKLYEEVTELKNELFLALCANRDTLGQCTNHPETIGEMVDVMVLADQFKEIYGHQMFDAIREFKINRTLERIKIEREMK